MYVHQIKDFNGGAVAKEVRPHSMKSTLEYNQLDSVFILALWGGGGVREGGGRAGFPWTCRSISVKKGGLQKTLNINNTYLITFCRA